ncbi:CTP synthetase [Candidatus Woesearchaeota archaeon CG10_big_fil_rev_8_21_14_0_10_45_16]|nr:MAG: CTP synthetase [Candidatus Woesearchaeota archaeon CG10_big_fil_rev_8_21_14_0_10_45_16]
MPTAPESETKYIFVSGGVISGIGKGVSAASIAVLLKGRGLKVSSIKCENYLNIDSGTINPIEHGDPFLCNDGLEADMDLGTYERFLGEEMGHANFTTMGQIYKAVIDRERSMGYNGEDVEAIPHVSDEIIERIINAGKGKDIVIVELGGTAGEYQNMLYYEACRIMKTTMPGKVINIHVSYMPLPKHLGEPKTKPTQMSVSLLMSMGIQPEFLILRGEVGLDERRRYVLGLRTSIRGENIFVAPDVESIYKVPLLFAEQQVDSKVLHHFGMFPSKIDLTPWEKLVQGIGSTKKDKIKVAVAGKYLSKNKGDFELVDVYNSLMEAIKHAGWKLNIEPEINFVSTLLIEEEGAEASLRDMDAIIVPIGWGKRGAEGKVQAVKYARENKIPYLGLCYGMQLACVEFARNVVGLEGADTEENDPDTAHKIVHSIPFNEKYQTIKGEGTSMRLGAYDCVIKPNTLAENLYSRWNGWKDQEKHIISERHRHRFEFNNSYREPLQQKGFVFSGTSPDDFFVEVIELPKEMHPFFIATQGHPEYKSQPLKPHPLFLGLLEAALANKK